MDSVDIGPVRVTIDELSVRFLFADPHLMTLKSPVSLEKELSDFVNRHRDEIAGKQLIIDLQDLPAISSRQLGTMLTIRKICEPVGGVKLASISQGVRHLLSLTRMTQYFNVADEAGLPPV